MRAPRPAPAAPPNKAPRSPYSFGAKFPEQHSRFGGALSAEALPIAKPDAAPPKKPTINPKTAGLVRSMDLIRAAEGERREDDGPPFIGLNDRS